MELRKLKNIQNYTKYNVNISNVNIKHYQDHLIEQFKINTIQMERQPVGLLLNPKLLSITSANFPQPKNCLEKEMLQEIDKGQNAEPQVQLTYLNKFRRDSAFSVYQPSQNQVSQQNQQQSKFIGHQTSKYQQTRQIRKGVENNNRKKMSRLQTKNLNRYFRSKINELLREIKQHHPNQEDRYKAAQILNSLNDSNRIMFSEIRQIIQDPWLHKKLKQCSASLLRYIHAGKMGMSSKLIMLKYFNRIMKAIQNPEKFTCWK